MMVSDGSAEKILIPVMHCFDNNYVIPAAVSFSSMLEHADKKYFYKLYVLHSDITIQNQRKLQRVVKSFENASLDFINMTNRFEDLWSKLQFYGHYSKEVLYKLLVASIFTQYEKLIITDVDVVFLGDISKSFFSLDEKSNILFAGVHQIMPKGSWIETYYKNYDENFGKDSSEELKICGGYLIANLSALRAAKTEEKFVKYLEENAYRLLQSEQDVINFCCSKEEIQYLPLNNVVCTYQYDLLNNEEMLATDKFYTPEQLLDSMKNPIQLHYATGKKPWNSPLCTKADVWYFYLIKSGMYFDFMQRDLALKSDPPVQIPNSEIRKGEPENRSPMMVSVLCCTYNQENYIQKTLDGIIGQEVDFPFEIIVADDASTDRTAEIIKKYHSEYPQLIHPIFREKNVGIGENYYDALTHISGRFLAICDGDDEWIDKTKLQKQVDFLLAHTDYNICCSSYVLHNSSTNEDTIFRPNDYISSAMKLKDEYNFKDFLYCRFIASCTVMMRWQLRNCIPDFLRYYSTIDFPLELLHASGGKIAVMNDEVFSKYNVHSGGITSQTGYSLEAETFCLINEVNEFLDYKFSSTINEFITSYKQYKRKKPGNLDICESKKEELAETSSNHRNLWDWLCLVYRECVPNIFQRIWRLIKRLIILIYKECIPNVLKRAYRKLKRTVTK